MANSTLTIARYMGVLRLAAIAITFLAATACDAEKHTDDDDDDRSEQADDDSTKRKKKKKKGKKKRGKSAPDPTASASAAPPPTPKLTRALFEGPAKNTDAKREFFGGLSVVPPPWNNHGNSPTGTIWMRSEGNFAGMQIGVRRPPKLPDTITHNQQSCEFTTFPATTEMGWKKVVWDKTERTVVGEERYPALVTRGFGPPDTMTWQVWCIEAHVGNKEVSGIVGFQKAHRAEYEELLLEFVRGWRG